MSPTQGSRSALNQLDDAKFSWFHVKAILISGIGFFTDAYDLFLVSLIVPMIGFARYPELNGKLPVSEDTAIKGIALVGTLLGQVIFGVLGDSMGRKSAYGLTLMIMVGATIASAVTSYGPNAVMISILCFWRLILGVGIGGDYPLSAVITSEYANRNRRGAMVAAVFSMQGIGMLAASLMVIIMLRIFKSGIDQCVVGEPCPALDHVWRSCVGLGAIPAAATYWLRKKLPETPRFTMHVKQDVELATKHVSSVMEDRPGQDKEYDNSNNLSSGNINGFLAGGQRDESNSGAADETSALLGGHEGALPDAMSSSSQLGGGSEGGSIAGDAPVFAVVTEAAARATAAQDDAQIHLVSGSKATKVSHVPPPLPVSTSARFKPDNSMHGPLLHASTQSHAQHQSMPMHSQGLGQGKVVIGRSHNQSQPGFSWSAFRQWCSNPRNFKVLAGCCSCWFLLDVAFYSNGLFTPTVLQDIGFLPSMPPATIYTKLHSMAAGNALVALLGGVPGYWVAVGLVEVTGRKPLQVAGFVLMTVFMGLLASLGHLSSWSYLTLFALNNLAANAGPNTTTFIVPGEVFPTRFRSTCHGISAACGKAGAVVGAFAFGHMFVAYGTQVTVGVLALFTAAGAVMTALIPESKGKSLEELGGE